MLFQRFFETISNLLPERFTGDLEALTRLNPDKMYIENVRSVFGISERAARRYCDTAVRQGIFSRFVEVRCPNGSVGATALTEDQLPKTVHCWQEEAGNFIESDIPTSDLPKAVFYRLNEDETTVRRANARPSQELRSRTTY